MCDHPSFVRVKKNNGLQETIDQNRQLVLYNCTECETTMALFEIVNGKERPINKHAKEDEFNEYRNIN